MGETSNHSLQTPALYHPLLLQVLTLRIDLAQTRTRMLLVNRVQLRTNSTPVELDLTVEAMEELDLLMLQTQH